MNTYGGDTGHATMQARKLIVTSNSLPTEWYEAAIKKNPWIGRALCRRFDGLVIANTGPSDSWTYLYGDAARRQLENPTTLRNKVGLDGTRVEDWSRDSNPGLYED